MYLYTVFSFSSRDFFPYFAPNSFLTSLLIENFHSVFLFLPLVFRKVLFSITNSLILNHPFTHHLVLSNLIPDQLLIVLIFYPNLSLDHFIKTYLDIYSSSLKFVSTFLIFNKTMAYVLTETAAGYALLKAADKKSTNLLL